jgi:hypothetical protein
MSFYPIYIPMNFGGGGGPIPLSGLLACLGIVGGGMYWYYNKQFKPSAELKIKYNKCNKNTQIDVCTKEHQWPDKLKTTTFNTQCLVDKGYIVRNPNTKYAYNKRHLYSIRHKEDAPISKEEFLIDCKECNAKTILEYKYKTIFSNTKRVKNEVSWQDAFKDRHE